MPISSAAFVRLPRDLMSASLRIRFSFCSTESEGDTPPARGRPEGAGADAGAPEPRVQVELRQLPALAEDDRVLAEIAQLADVSRPRNRPGGSSSRPGSISSGGTPFSSEKSLDEVGDQGAGCPPAAAAAAA
jgi:hypothetical protein